MSDDTPKLVLGMLALGLIIGFWIGMFGGRSDMKTEAVSNGAAHYDQKTGEFKWGKP